MGGSPSKRSQEGLFIDNQKNQNENLQENNQKERSLSLPSNNIFVSNSSQQKHIVPIKGNRSITVQNYPSTCIKNAIRVPTINSSANQQRTVFSGLQDSLHQNTIQKGNISNLDTSIIDFQSSIPIVHQSYPLQNCNTIQHDLNNSQFSITQQKFITQPNHVLTAPIQMKSYTNTPQKQVPKIVYSNNRNPQEIQQKASPYRPIQKVVIYEQSSNNCSAVKQNDSTVTKLNTSLTQFSPKQIIKKQSYASSTCNQPKINQNLTPLSIELDFQNSLRTNISNNFLSENIRVLDLLHKNKGIIQQNSVSGNQSTINGSIVDNNSTVQSTFQNCSQYFILNNTSGRQVLQNHQLTNNSIYNTEDTINENNILKENILIIDKSHNITSEDKTNSQFHDENNFKEISAQNNKQIIPKQNHVKINNNNIKDMFQNSQIMKQDQTQTIQKNDSLMKNNQQYINQNQSICQFPNSNKSKINDQLSNELTQKKQIIPNTLNEINLTQQDAYKNQQMHILGAEQRSKMDSSQNYSILSPFIKKNMNQNDDILQDDQVSLIYSATENQKKSGNSIFQHQIISNSNNNLQKNNFIQGSEKQYNSIDHNNVSNIVFQNSSEFINNSNQVLQNARTNNFQFKNKHEERQIVVKLEDIYKQMDTSTQKLQENNQMRVSQTNLKCDDKLLANNSFILSDQKNNCSGQITNSVTQLPIIQNNHNPVSYIQKINPVKQNIIFYSSQPYSAQWNLRSQSMNQSAFIEQSVSLFDSVKKTSRERYYSVENTSQKNDGILLLKDHIQYQNDQSNQTSYKSQEHVKQTILLPVNQVQVPLFQQKINSNIISITNQLLYEYPQHLNNELQLQNKSEPSQYINTLKQKQNQIEQKIQNNSYSVPQNQNAYDFMNASNQIFVKSHFNKTNETQMKQFNEKDTLVENVKQQVQSTLIPMSSSLGIKDFQHLRNQTDSFPIIKSYEQQNNSFKSAEFDSEIKFQAPDLDLQTVPQLITQVELCKQEKGDTIHNLKQQNPIYQQIQHTQQNEQFKINSLKLKHKDIFSSMESIGATSSNPKEQTSSCEEFKQPFIQNKQEQIKLTNQNLQINQNPQCFYKNQVRIQQPKQEQNKSFAIEYQAKDIAQKLQEHIDVKLDIQNEQKYNSSNKINSLLSTKSNIFAYNSQNTNNVLHNTTVDFQLTHTDDEIIQNNQNTIADIEKEVIKQNLLLSLPKKKLNPHDNIQIYLNFNSECSDYSSAQSDYYDKMNNQIPQPVKELSKTRQLNNPLSDSYERNIQKNKDDNNSFKQKIINNQQNINTINLQNKIRQIQNNQLTQNNSLFRQDHKQQTLQLNNQLKNQLNNLQKNELQSQQANSQNSSLYNSQNNSSRQRNNNSQRMPKYKFDEQNNSNQEKERRQERGNERQIMKMAQNELSCITQETYPSENTVNENGKLCELLLLEQQDNCKKTLHTYQNIIDMEDQRKSPKEFNDHSVKKCFDQKRFLTQNDQEEEDSVQNYKDAMNSMQEQSMTSQTCGAQNSTQFHLSKQQIFSSVNSYNLHNSTIIKKVNNKFQALSSFSQNNPVDIDKERINVNSINNINVDNEASDGEIYFKYCKKTGVLIPLTQNKIEKLPQEKSENKPQKQQYYFKLRDNSKQISQNNKSYLESISKYNGSLNRSLEKRQSLSINPYPIKQQETSFSNQQNKQYANVKTNSNLYTDVLERYSKQINKRAREQKTNLQQNQIKKVNSKDNQTTQMKKNNLRI